MLRPGDRIRLDGGAGTAGRVGRLIGSGGQGAVYELHLDGTIPGVSPGTELVLKWYHDVYATHFRREQLAAVRALIRTGPPSPRFLWPLALADAPHRRSFGFVMAARPAGYLELEEVVNGNLGAVRYESLLVFLVQVLTAVRQLHVRGLAYRDINVANFFLRPDDGAALICDTDNIGFENRVYMGVRGRDEYMAPELVRDPGLGPNANTDRHAIAVLVFMLLFRWHPLVGRGTRGLDDDRARRQHFGLDPRFCLDPDGPNRVPPEYGHVEQYWRWYPASLRNLVWRAFTRGLGNPAERVTETEWLEALEGLLDSMFRCAACGQLTFHDPGAPDRCRRPGCDGCCGVPRMMVVRRAGHRPRPLTLFAGRRLLQLHVSPGHDTTSIGNVVVGPRGVLALRNDDDRGWAARRARTGLGSPLLPGATVPLDPGTVVTIGRDVTLEC